MTNKSGGIGAEAVGLWDLQEKARSFLVKNAFPLWSTTGRYSNGCFVEQLDLSGRPVDPGYTRTRVQARQIYVFSHAHIAGLIDASSFLPQSLEFFLRSCWLGPERGWAKRISREGAVVDAGYDLYDVAFAVFALGWSYRLNANSDVLAIAEQTLDLLDRHARDPNGGFRNDDGPELPRLQNPHMHLAEAMVVWAEASGRTRFRDLADELVELFCTRFIDNNGVLGEYFDADWQPLPGPASSIVEPGHMFEWAWILGEYARFGSRDVKPIVERLLAFAFAHGYDDETGLTKDQIDRVGHVIDASHRSWPQTEALKACAVSRSLLAADMPIRQQRICDALFRHFLDPAPLPGTWIDHFNSDWSRKVDKIPATSLYHLTLAFMCLLETPAKL